jgi:Ricin-type beta-trefoil lectin domain/delta endotoxin, N-terminal domain
MRIIRSRRVIGGSVTAMLTCCGLFGVLAASSGASKRPAATASTLGNVTSVALAVRRPVGARMVLVPLATYDVQGKTLQELRARDARVSATFLARIVTSPTHGKGRTLLVLRRSVSGVSVRASRPRVILGALFAFKPFTLSVAQTTMLKRAAKGGPLRVVSSASYTVAFKNAQGRAVVRRGRAGSTNLPLILSGPRLGGADLHTLDVALRGVIARVESSSLACQIRNTLVQRLRLTDSALAAGNRSAAAGLLRIWIYMAASMRAGGVLTPAQTEMLRVGLSPIRDRVGAGWPAKPARVPAWPALPSCTPGAHTAQGTQTFDTGSILEATVWAAVRSIPKAGQILAPLLKILWPDSGPTLDDAINKSMSATAQSNAKKALDGLNNAVGLFAEKEADLGFKDPLLQSYIASTQTAFSTGLPWLNDGAGFPTDTSKPYEVLLLPLYAQYENLYLAWLRDLVLAGPSMGLTQAAIDSAEKDLNSAGRAIPSGIPDAITYTDAVYNAGLAAKGTSSDPLKQFDKTNGYQRDMQTGVKDFEATWKFLDPMQYPYGDPNFRLTRMIYADRVGTTSHTFQPPANVQYPLSSLNAWTRPEYQIDDKQNENWLAAIQTNNQPLVGAVTGTTSHATQTSYTTAPGSTLGPIVEVDASQWAEGIAGIGIPHNVQNLRFTFFNGGPGGKSTAVPGGDFYDHEPQYFSYPDETLATAKIMGTSKPFANGDVTADSIVFGFRYSDSFYPSGEVHSVGVAGKCLDLPSWADGTFAALSTCSSTPAGAQDWTYNSSTRELSSSGGTTNGGPVCLQAVGGGTTPGTLVQGYHYHCTDPTVQPTLQQQWLVSSDGTIINAKSGLCLAPVSDNTSVSLQTCTGTSAAQQWTTPWTTRQPGAMRAPGTQACLDVTGGSRQDGTALEMYSCNGTWQQGWNYDSSSTLRVYGGTKCIAPEGGTPSLRALAVVDDCNGSAAQQWTVKSDGTIANRQSPDLCLLRTTMKISDGTSINVPVNSNGSAVDLYTCNSTNQAQKWAFPTG